MTGFLLRLTSWACSETRVAIVDGKTEIGAFLGPRKELLQRVTAKLDGLNS